MQINILEGIGTDLGRGGGGGALFFSPPSADDSDRGPWYPT